MHNIMHEYDIYVCVRALYNYIYVLLYMNYN
jgi:hypothetical protein